MLTKLILVLNSYICASNFFKTFMSQFFLLLQFVDTTGVVVKKDFGSNEGFSIT